MFRDGFTLLTLGALLCGGLLSSSLHAEPLHKQPSGVNNALAGLRVQVEDQHPFTHFAYIPAGSDLTTIRFEKATTVEVPVKIRYTTDTNYCAELALFRDPGGSMECPSRKTESATTAYEVTYSFRGEELSSDEFGLRHSLFQVHFRPDELVSIVRNALSNRKLSRAEKASYFTVRTSRGYMRQVVIDEGQSNFCETTLRDALWTLADPNCQDRINYKTITTPSDYITVRVDPIPAH
jgi:hypothetical protein